jgi:hypothetical protein
VTGTYASALLICFASLVVGQAILALCGRERFSWLSPAVGLATLTAAAGFLIRLPGHAITTFVCLAIITLAALVYAWPRSEGLSVALPQLLVVAGITLLAASLPFIATGRTGILGVSVQNDMASHLFLADWLNSRSGETPMLYSAGYPLGPHALVVSVAHGINTSLVNAFSGLTLAVPVLTAFAALAALRDLPPLRRTLAAILVALPYMAASYLAQGLFKETMQNLFFIAFAIYLAELAREMGEEPGDAPLVVAAVPLGLLAAGSTYTYGFPGLFWLFGGLALWGLVRAVIAGGALIGNVIDEVRDALPAVIGAAAALLAITAPEWGRVLKFSSFTTFAPNGPGLGNLYGPIKVYEALGIWFSGDFRIVPTDLYIAGFLSALAAVALAYGFYWWVRRGELAIPSALAVAAGIYVGSKLFGTPYTSAKALEIAAPLVMLVTLRALIQPLTRRPRRPRVAAGPAAVSAQPVPDAPSLPEGLGSVLGRYALAVVMVVGAVWSSFLVLRDARVGTDVHINELAQLRPIVQGTRVLWLGRDDFIAWELRGAKISTPVKTEVESNRDARNVPTRLAKSSAQPFPALDFDSVTTETLNQFAYVITTNTRHGSEPPSNFKLAKETRDFQLWKREGETPPRETLVERAAPADNLDCGTPEGRTLSQQPGVASVLPQRPYTGLRTEWYPYTSPPDDQPVQQQLDLPAGSWDISLQYESPQPLHFTAGDLNAKLPPVLDRNGPYWPVGTLHTDGTEPTFFTIRVDEPPKVGRLLGAQTNPHLNAISAFPTGKEALIPLSQACKHWIDWYRVEK